MAEFIGGLIVGLLFALQTYFGQKRTLKIKEEHIDYLQKDNKYWFERYSKLINDK
jgi:hypothetical protein